ncbi:hypothetical protein [Aureibacillus halotolerans]|uniref:hypothetical protein n=1 Tax=Aureibacillus halotolerans TaxID=1508390 RepID=UPI0014151168|nr:hypothetical protein [Aureibacillus halotolerans]
MSTGQGEATKKASVSQQPDVCPFFNNQYKHRLYFREQAYNRRREGKANQGAVAQ